MCATDEACEADQFCNRAGVCQTLSGCTSNDDCDVICLFAGDSDYGFCSVPCEDVFDCPDFWECVDVGNATLTYCAPG